jgi:hypothetical protein
MKKKMLISLSLSMVFWLVKAIPCLGYFGDVNLKAGLDINQSKRN